MPLLHFNGEEVIDVLSAITNLRDRFAFAVGSSLAAYKLAARITDDMGVLHPLKVLCILGKVTPFA